MIDMLRYAVTGKEFTVMDDLHKLGITHWRGTTVVFKRRPTSRMPDAYDFPALPNYLWLTVQPEQIHLMRDIKFLTPTFLFMTRADVRAFGEYAAQVDEREREARRIAGNRDAIQIYKKGEAIQIKDGPFAGKLAHFRTMVQNAADLFPKVEADVEMFGGMTRVRFDPLAVDKVRTA
jgi:hypothetical protein